MTAPRQPSSHIPKPPAESLLLIKAVPGAKRDEIVGWLGDRLKVRVSAPPEAGRANAAILDLLASHLKLDAWALTLVTGQSSPLKSIRVPLESSELLRRLPRRQP